LVWQEWTKSISSWLTKWTICFRVSFKNKRRNFPRNKTVKKTANLFQRTTLFPSSSRFSRLSPQLRKLTILIPSWTNTNERWRKSRKRARKNRKLPLKLRSLQKTWGPLKYSQTREKLC
jgi:hypothetical protein